MTRRKRDVSTVLLFWEEKKIAGTEKVARKKRDCMRKRGEEGGGASVLSQRYARKTRLYRTPIINQKGGSVSWSVDVC